MVHAIIKWSLHNRLIVFLGTIALAAFGVHAALNLNVEAYPDPTPPLVEVITQNPGASPEEMERLVGIPIETALNGMPGLEDLRSTSIAGLNDIKCQFSYGTDYWAARQEVINRLGQAELPPGIIPRLSPWSPTGEIVRYVLDGPGYTTKQLKAVQDWIINRSLKSVPGVIDVTGFGGEIKQYQIQVDTRLLKQYNLTMQQVEDAINRSNANVGGDVLTMGSQMHNVRAIGLLGAGVDPLDPANITRGAEIEAEKLDDIRGVVITTNNGVPIYVRQVANVVIEHRPRLGKVARTRKEVNGSPILDSEGKPTMIDEDDVVEGIVLMRKYEKSLPTANAVAAKMKEIQESGLLPKGMTLQVFNQRTDLVHVTTHNVMHNLVVGILLVIAVLFVFLGDVASAFIVALVVPLALLFAISVLYLQGKSANLLSIGAVDFGIIVDSSVIIVERVYSYVSHHAHNKSYPLRDQISDATKEIQRSLLFATLIIICAFLPLFTMSGPAGALFGPMANTYAFSILGALLIAMTLAPVLCSLFFHNKVEKETIVDRVMKWVYLRVLAMVLKFRMVTLAIFVVLFAWTISLLPGLGGQFMPELEEGNLWIRCLLPRTVSLEAASRLAPRIRAEIASVPEVRGVMSHIGRPDDGTDVTSFFNLEFNVPLRPMEQWRPGMTRIKIEEELTEKFNNYVGCNFSFSQLIRDNVEEALSGVKGANSVKLFGTDLQILESTGAKVVNVLRGVPGIENVGLFHIIGQPNMEILIDREACSRYGVNVADVESMIQVAIGGRAFSQMVEGEKTYDIVLRLPKGLREDPTVIDRIPVDVPAGEGKGTTRIPLGQLTKIRPHQPGASYIYRENSRRFIPIKFSVSGGDLASAIAEAQKRVEASKVLPEGYRIEWSGEFAQMEEANGRLMVMVPISFVLIMVLLYTTFNSFKDAVLVMASVGTAAMGGVWALWFTGTPFSISAAVGFISIFGVAVQNGVLLIADFNRMRADGVPVREAVFRGSETLLRPVVMISLTAILGLLPAALADSVGSQAQKPLAIVVVGGMTVAMLLAQFLIPVLYSYFPAPAGLSGQEHMLSVAIVNEAPTESDGASSSNHHTNPA